MSGHRPQSPDAARQLPGALWRRLLGGRFRGRRIVLRILGEDSHRRDRFKSRNRRRTGLRMGIKKSNTQDAATQHQFGRTHDYPLGPLECPNASAIRLVMHARLSPPVCADIGVLQLASTPMTDIYSSTQSPCVRNCCLDDDLICLGCYRTLEEIKEWGLAGSERRRVILQSAERRRQASVSANWPHA